MPAVPAMPTPAQKPVMPTEPTPAAPAPTEPVPPKTTGTSADESGILTVWVPYEAKVTINGQETQCKGSQRHFVSYGLVPGLSYKYVVRAQLVRNGQTQEETQTIILTAGQVSAVAFGFNTNPTEQVAMSH